MVDVPKLPEARLKAIYRAYLEQRGVDASPIAEGGQKTPDFELVWSQRAFLNELKAPEMHFNEELGVYSFKTTQSKLLRFYRTAVKQFHAVDPGRQKPRILTFMSCQFQLNLHSLCEAMQGGVTHPKGGWIAPLYETDSYQRWAAQNNLIDGLVWLQLNPDSRQLFQAGYFTLEEGQHETAVSALFEELRKVQVGENDRNILISAANS